MSVNDTWSSMSSMTSVNTMSSFTFSVPETETTSMSPCLVCASHVRSASFASQTSSTTKGLFTEECGGGQLTADTTTPLAIPGTDDLATKPLEASTSALPQDIKIATSI